MATIVIVVAAIVVVFFHAAAPVLLLAAKGALAAINKTLHSSKLYNAFQFSVGAVAAFSGDAYLRMKQGSPICFVAGTMVLTASGHVAIENIKAGNIVIAIDPETMEMAEK